MFGIDGEVLSRPLKRQILTVVLHNIKKSAAKHSMEKPTLLFWAICLQYFVQGWEFHWVTGH